MYIFIQYVGFKSTHVIISVRIYEKMFEMKVV